MAACSSKCPSCGSESIESDEGRNVCTSCGHLLTDKDQFRHDPTQEWTQNSYRYFSNRHVPAPILRNLPGTRITPAKKLGLKKAETLAANYRFGSAMSQQLATLYTEASTHQEFNCCAMKTKEILAACCAYNVMLDNNWAIAINHICNSIGCDNADFSKVYYRLRSLFPLQAGQAKPIEHLVAATLSDSTFPDEEKHKLETRVIELISLLRLCWNAEGKSPIHTIYAAAFLAWKSLDPSVRKKTPLTVFCSLHNIPFKQTIADRSRSLTKTLMELARKIPWLSDPASQVNKKNIILYLDDIIKYSVSLIYDVNKDKDNDLFKGAEKPPTQINRIPVPVEDGRVMEENDNFDDLSDTELDGYLRSAHEVKLIKKLKKRLKT